VSRSWTVVALAYALAGAAAFGTAALLDGPVLAVTLAADVVATVVVFALSMVVRNASLYDPYWSVAPPVIALAWAIVGDGVGVRQVLVVALVTIWAVRLTGNWVSGWRGLSHEDWRYVQLRATRGRVPWWVVNLGGIQLMPTLVVYAGMLSVWPAVAAGHHPLWILDGLAVVVTAGAIALETVADRQLRRFTRIPANQRRIADIGVWRHSRHPNYLGEIGFWWGLWFFGLAADARWWWTVVGPLGMVVLFVAASIPLMDRRSEQRRPGYAEYKRQVPALVPGMPLRRGRRLD